MDDVLFFEGRILKLAKQLAIKPFSESGFSPMIRIKRQT